VVAIAEIWLPIIGAGICIAWAIGAWYAGHKMLATWLVFGGIVSLALLGTLQWQHTIHRDEVAQKDQGKDNPLRAYVFTDMNEVIHEPGRPAKVILHIKNSGQTPAYDLTWRARFSFASIELEDQVAVDPDAFAAKQILAQGGFLAYVYDFPETDWKPTFDGLLREEKAAIYGIGQIRYKDIDGKERYTDYLIKSGGRFGTKSGIAPGKFGIISVKSN
jgi:hypothetical protein